MQLRELSSLTGMPIASIKYYLREGLLPVGKRVTATRADYDETHVRRLKTIQALRNINGLSVAQIRAIVELVDRGTNPVEIMRALQREIQSLGEPVSGRTEAGDAVVRLRGWPDVPTAARGALDDHLEKMTELGVALPDEALDVYSRAVDLIAQVDINDAAAAAAEDLDTLVLRTAVGIHMHSQLVLKLLALAQASRSIARYGRAPGPDGIPPSGPGTDAGTDAGPGSAANPGAPTSPLTP